MRFSTVMVRIIFSRIPNCIRMRWRWNTWTIFHNGLNGAIKSKYCQFHYSFFFLFFLTTKSRVFCNAIAKTRHNCFNNASLSVFSMYFFFTRFQHVHMIYKEAVNKMISLINALNLRFNKYESKIVFIKDQLKTFACNHMGGNMVR